MELMKLKYNQSFHRYITIGNLTVRGDDIWRLCQWTDSRKEGGNRFLAIQNHHGRVEWANWEEEVEIVS